MNQKQGLSGWSIVFLFAEPFVVWQGETRWGNWIRGPSAPGWLPLAKSSILMQVPLTTIVGVVVVAGYALLPDETKGWIRDWRDGTWDRIRHRE
jgi:hypothetical protein